MSSDIQPWNDWILAKEETPEEISAGGIIIPSSAVEKKHQAVVVAVGPKVAEVLVGDIIGYGRYSGHEMEVKHEKCFLIREEEVLYRIEKETEKK